jgi:NTP pyrophosphatase (non-canonical NTP hydrolase)
MKSLRAKLLTSTISEVDEEYESDWEEQAALSLPTLLEELYECANIFYQYC